MNTLRRVLAHGKVKTNNLGGSSTTSQFVDAIIGVWKG